MKDDILVLDIRDNPDIYAASAHVLLGDVHLLLRGCRDNRDVIPGIIHRTAYSVFGESPPRVELLKQCRRGTMLVTRWKHKHGFRNGACVTVVHQIDSERY